MIKYFFSKLKSEKVLDSILKFFYDTNKPLSMFRIEQESIYKDRKESKLDFYIAVQKLEKDSLIIIKNMVDSDGNKVSDKSIGITYDGRLFFERGGYKNNTIRVIWSNIYVVAKAVIHIINISIIIILGWLNYSVTKETKTKDERIDNFEKVINSQKKTIDSLSIMLNNKIHNNTIKDNPKKY